MKTPGFYCYLLQKIVVLENSIFNSEELRKLVPLVGIYHGSVVGVLL